MIVGKSGEFQGGQGRRLTNIELEVQWCMARELANPNDRSGIGYRVLVGAARGILIRFQAWQVAEQPIISRVERRRLRRSKSRCCSCGEECSTRSILIGFQARRISEQTATSRVERRRLRNCLYQRVAEGEKIGSVCCISFYFLQTVHE